MGRWWWTVGWEALAFTKLKVLGNMKEIRAICGQSDQILNASSMFPVCFCTTSSGPRSDHSGSICRLVPSNVAVNLRILSRCLPSSVSLLMFCYVDLKVISYSMWGFFFGWLFFFGYHCKVLLYLFGIIRSRSRQMET